MGTLYKFSKGYNIKLKGLKKMHLTVASYDLLCELCHEYGNVEKAFPHIHYDKDLKEFCEILIKNGYGQQIFI